MAYKALIPVLMGVGDPVQPGDTIPSKYTDHLGQEHDVDFDRLVEIGAAEQTTGRKSSSQSKD